jgi:aldehyde dehydrogenase (NAD+)
MGSIDSAFIANSGLATEAADLLAVFGVSRDAISYSGPNPLVARSPINGELIGRLRQHSPAEVTAAIAQAQAAFLKWRLLPAPRRGELLRLINDEVRRNKNQLGRLVSIEAGKILSEGTGEVQELIDIFDFAIGLSRQLYGLTIASERGEHRMMESWHPLGVIGVITAFNFPVGVWSWNASLSLVCGNAIAWKPSEKSPLVSLALHAIFQKAAQAFGPDAPPGLQQLLIGGREVGEALVMDAHVPLVSATGSTNMGRAIGPLLAKRFARSLLELGGNNAAIVAPSADLKQALRAVAFAAMGTAGQRCTSLRRLIVHESIYAEFVTQLKRVAESVVVGSPLDANTLVGPLIDESAFRNMQAALAEARQNGGVVTGGERQHASATPNAFYVRPALVEMPAQCDPVGRETFAPILYVLKYRAIDEAIALNNGVAAGLSSAIFTLDMREAEKFVSATGSDCGIANVNLGTSGAEIGGAFGGEKETGGGREAGSDSWKAYMRRATNTINYGRGLPLAQGVSFPVD